MAVVGEKPGVSGARWGDVKMKDNPSKRLWSHWYWLFVVQFVIALWIPFYNTVEPTLIGLPFFYWAQMAVVLLCAGLTAIVYFATRRN